VTRQENVTQIYQIVPAKTGVYQTETVGSVYLYRQDDWYYYESFYGGTEEIRLEKNKIYYLVLDDSYDSFKYSLLTEEQEGQTEYTITLQKGQTLRIPGLYQNDRWYSFDHATSSNPSVIRISDSRMELRETGTATVTVTYDYDKERVFHITVTTGNTLVLPAQLQTIETDAFNGDTSARFVKLGENVDTVKSGAFANIGSICLTVENCYTTFENGVFTNSQPVIICEDGGYVPSYCRNNGIPYFFYR